VATVATQEPLQNVVPLPLLAPEAGAAGQRAVGSAGVTWTVGLRRAFLASRKTWAILLFLGLWEVAPRVGLVDATFLPSFSTVVVSLAHLVASGELFGHIAASLQRALAGMGLAIVVAVPLGFLVGWYKGFATFVDPLLQTLRQTSALALFPVFMLLFGIGEVSKTAIIFWGCLWPILLNTISGVRNADPLLVKSARSMGASQWDIFRKVVLPGSYPAIFTGLRLSATISIVMLTAAEMMGANNGIGYLVLYSQQTFDVPALYAAIITIAILGLLFNHLLVRLERRAHVWKEEPPA
jgi:NitT/TauT family transport system permease protein